MPIGSNMNLKDKLIKDTTKTASNTNNTSITGKISKKQKASNARIRNNTDITSKGNIKSKISTKSITNNINNKNNDTANTVKMTFYVQSDVLNNLYNYAYWDRMSVTRAFNRVMRDGLKGKDTRQKKTE